MECISECCDSIKGQNEKPKWFDDKGKAIAICVPYDKNNHQLDCLSNHGALIMLIIAICSFILLLLIIGWCIFNNRRQKLAKKLQK